MAEIELEGMWKVYPDGTVAVREFDLHVADGEFLVLVGPSGCGKTTVLRMVAGLEDISAGHARIGGRVVDRVAPRDRDVAMVFQNYALYPHLSVRENIAFGLRLRKVPKSEIDQRVKRAAALLGIDQLLDRRPRALSGGQRQRVAMGRAIVREPAAFLMDEPLSNLDAKLRVQMRAEIMRIQQELQVTTLYVTHDQVEAMTMGHRVAVLRKGVLQQVDAPERLYDHPVNLFVGGFIGSPSMNLVRARLDRLQGPTTEPGLRVDIGPHQVRLSADVVAQRPDLEGYVGREVIMGIRPEDLHDARLLAGANGEWPSGFDVTVDLVEKLGAETLLHFALRTPPVATDETKELQVAELGEDASAHGDTSELVARLGARSAVEKGDRVRLVPDLLRAHFFDPEDGRSIASTVDERELTAKGAVR